MKALKRIFLLFILIFFYIAVLCKNCIPETIAVKGEEIKISDIEVIPIGEIVGIKMYTNGILVVGTSTIYGEDGIPYKPFENTDIKEGDSIIAINDKLVSSTYELTNLINLSNGEDIKIKYISNNKTNECVIKPVKDANKNYKLGLWVRDSAAGVGTITFYNEQMQTFAGLGHAIVDIDTGETLQISSGEIDDVNIISIVKGISQEPGKVQGSIISNSTIGSIYKNTQYGIYGIIKNPSNLKIDNLNKMKIATRQEISIGKAYILSNIDGEFKKYEIEIQRTYLNNNYDNRSMLIKVTDEELLKKTGGIIQGMSGSPIIQNDKLCGAVTHVFINNPTIGYAVFADRMIMEIADN